MNGHRVADSCAKSPAQTSRSNSDCRLVVLGVACALLVFGSGCGNLSRGDNAQVRAARSSFLTATEPKGGLPLTEIRKALAPNESVVVIGRIGVPDQEPWIAGKAVFAIRDAAGEKPGHHGGHGHDPASCPFCKRKVSHPDSTAFVQFIDERGEIIGIDARELFELTENQCVVVQGKAAIVGPDILVITAEQLYLRSE